MVCNFSSQIPIGMNGPDSGTVIAPRGLARGLKKIYLQNSNMFISLKVIKS